MLPEPRTDISGHVLLGNQDTGVPIVLIENSWGPYGEWIQLWQDP